MRGDILIVGQNHTNAAQEIFEMLLPDIRRKGSVFLITIAGESGAGKSEIALALSNLLDKNGFSSYIIQQDDYFRYPPKTNARMREEDIRRVGPGEVRIDLINKTVASILAGEDPVEKPLVIFSEDQITTEKISFKPYSVIILEGTYTTLVDDIDARIFIDRDMDDTREDRLKRNREKQDDYLEQILLIEHEIISKHKDKADIIINREFTASKRA